MGWFSNKDRSLSSWVNEIQDEQTDLIIIALNIAEEQFGEAIESGKWKSIQHAHHVREETRRAVEENSESPSYSSDTHRWFRRK